MKRKTEREIIILALYMIELTKATIDEALHSLKEIFGFEEPTDYILQSIRGVIANIEEIDAIIARNLFNYTIDRLSYIDRQIVRFAT